MLVAIRAWFQLSILVGLWIPAFAGMTGRNRGMAGGICRPLFAPRRFALLYKRAYPLFAVGMLKILNHDALG